VLKSPLGSHASAVRETIAALCDQHLEPDVLVREVAERVRRVVPYDTAAWMHTDPETLLPTDVLTIGVPSNDSVSIEKARSEFVDHDFNRFIDLDQSRQSVVTLATATNGDLGRSERHRSVYFPRGLHDELRLVARSGASTWAMACLVRASDLPLFTADEARFLAAIARHVGDGLRASLAARTSQFGAGVRGGRGMLVLDRTGRIEAATPEADQWLRRLPQQPPGETPIAVAMVALQAAISAAQGGRPAKARIRMSDGGWLLVHADILVGDVAEDQRIAVMLEPVGPAEMLPMLFALHSFTARERQVADFLLAGHSTDEIASRLNVSRYTVRDHIKSMFTKTRVNSRAELTAILAGESIAS
jgi:DNA-binding CsgD family transcriptional regulator